MICFLFEFVYFYTVLTKDWIVHKADLITVFAGAANRVDKGYALANAGIAPRMCISPRTKTQYQRDSKKYQVKNSVRFEVEQRADTTFQNAWLVGVIIRKLDARSTVLVTDGYHMPRSFLLFQMALIGQPTKILPFPVDDKPFPKNPLRWTAAQKKRVYNEMVETWGSLIELVQYKIRGGMPERSLKKSKTITFLRDLLLFEV